jgi:hypothetical protein
MGMVVDRWILEYVSGVRFGIPAAPPETPQIWARFCTQTPPPARGAGLEAHLGPESFGVWVQKCAQIWRVSGGAAGIPNSAPKRIRESTELRSCGDVAGVLLEQCLAASRNSKPQREAMVRLQMLLRQQPAVMYVHA